MFTIAIGKKTLCLEIQGVLARVSTFVKSNSDELIEVESGEPGGCVEFSIDYRPYLYEFLDDMAEKYELVIYSRLDKEIIKKIVSSIEKKKKYFSYCFGKEFCFFANFSFAVKCLDFLYSNRLDRDIIAVDTKAASFPLSPDNHLII